ncbi:hypothetical protein SUDANB15_06918 [Streptomyces sp. enrichment culture]
MLRGQRPHLGYLTIKNHSSSTTVGLEGYVVTDAAGNGSAFAASHLLRPGDHVKLRGGNGTDSDKDNVVYRDTCTFPWNDDKDTTRLCKPTGSRADVPSYARSGSGPDRNGYVSFHK